MRQVSVGSGRGIGRTISYALRPTPADRWSKVISRRGLCAFGSAARNKRAIIATAQTLAVPSLVWWKFFDSDLRQFSTLEDHAARSIG